MDILLKYKGNITRVFFYTKLSLRRIDCHASSHFPSRSKSPLQHSFKLSNFFSPLFFHWLKKSREPLFNRLLPHSSTRSRHTGSLVPPQHKTSGHVFLRRAFCLKSLEVLEGRWADLNTRTRSPIILFMQIRRRKGRGCSRKMVFFPNLP